MAMESVVVLNNLQGRHLVLKQPNKTLNPSFQQPRDPKLIQNDII